MAKIETRVYGAAGFNSAIGGSGSSNQIAYFSSGANIASSADLTLLVGQTAGTVQFVKLTHQDNTNVGSNAYFETIVGGASGGHPQYRMTVTGATTWLMGIRNTDSDSLYVCTGTDITSNVKLILTTGAAAYFASTGTQWGNGAASGTQVSHTLGLSTGSMCISGDSGPTNGANTVWYGASHATKASYYEMRSGSTVRFAMNGVTGLAAFNTAPAADVALVVSNGGGLTGTAQAGIYTSTVFQSGATGSGVSVQAAPSTVAASFTMGALYGFYCSAPVVGSGSTVTRFANFRGEASTAATNNAMFADNASFTGNYFINQSGTIGSYLGGQLEVGSAVNGLSIVANNKSVVNILNDGTATFTVGTTAAAGILTVTQATNGKTAVFLIHAGSSPNISEISDPDSSFSTTAGTGSSTNVTFNGSTTVTVENKNGGTKGYVLQFLRNVA